MWDIFINLCKLWRRSRKRSFANWNWTASRNIRNKPIWFFSRIKSLSDFINASHGSIYYHLFYLQIQFRNHHTESASKLESNSKILRPMRFDGRAIRELQRTALVQKTCTTTIQIHEHPWHRIDRQMDNYWVLPVEEQTVTDGGTRRQWTLSRGNIGWRLERARFSSTPTVRRLYIFFLGFGCVKVMVLDSSCDWFEFGFIGRVGFSKKWKLQSSLWWNVWQLQSFRFNVWRKILYNFYDILYEIY